MKDIAKYLPGIGWSFIFMEYPRLLVYVVVLMGGIALVWIASNDAASAGDGKYPIRIPIG